MMRHYPDLGNAYCWSCRAGNLLQPIRSTVQIWVVTRQQYGISALVLSDVISRVSRNVGCLLRLAAFLRLTVRLVSATLVRSYKRNPRGRIFDQYLGIANPYPVQNKKNSKIHSTLFMTTPSNLLPCLGQRTKWKPSYFKAIHWQFQ